MSELTPAALYDRLHEWFGIGSWDEATSKEPFYRARMNEIGKLKRMLTSRKVKPEAVLEAAEYARRHDVPISEFWQLFDLIAKARREARTGVHDVRAQLNAAAAEAQVAGETTWAHRLYNSDVHAGAQVLAEWEGRRR